MQRYWWSVTVRAASLSTVQAALALGASKVDFASDDAGARKLAANSIETDFVRRQGRYSIVADCGARTEGLRYAIDSTAPEGICHSASYLPVPEIGLPIGKLYTRGIQFFIGRTHAVSILPEVMQLIAERRLRPEEITTRQVDWEEAPIAWLEDSIKLVITRN